MSSREVTVRIEPGNKVLRVVPGISAREAAALAGLSIDSPCGGQGSCGKCKVRVSSDAGPLTPAEYALLKDIEIAAGYRLACQIRIKRPLYFEVSEDALQRASFQILTHSGRTAGVIQEPSVRTVEVNLPPPTLVDGRADLRRLREVLPPVEISLELLRQLPGKLRQAQFQGTALIVDGWLLTFTPRLPQPTLAVALDIGTTTLVAALLDAATGEVLARSSALNPQVHYGDDVLTRISHVAGRPERLQRLQQDLIETMNALVQNVCAQANVTPEQVLLAMCAGNTTMQHLLLAVDPAAIGLSPYVAALDTSFSVHASLLGLRLHPQANVHTLPMIGGYVGGDTVAGMLATLQRPGAEPMLFIDIGTNGEMVLYTGEHMVATSCAAGPAFEGARIGQGMRAAEGAIEAVAIREDVHFTTIGNRPALGICGSALIDAAAELLRVGVISCDGTLLSASEVPVSVPERVRARIGMGDRGPVFVIAEAHETQSGQRVALTQRDVRELQLATAAIRSGVRTLVTRMGLRLEDLQRVLVAGAFGNYIRCHNAQRIGLLPWEVPEDKFEFVGNASLAGACLAAVDLAHRRRAELLARQTEHLDLSLDPEFQELFVECLMFPEIQGEPSSASRGSSHAS